MDAAAKSSFESIHQLILEAQAEQACWRMSAIAHGKLNRFADELDNLHQRIHRHNEKIIKHLITYEQQEIGWNNIYEALRKLLEQMEVASLEPELLNAMPEPPPAIPEQRTAQPFPKSGRNQLSKTVVLAGVVVAVLAGTWAVVNFFKPEKTKMPASFNLSAGLRMANGFEHFQPRGEVQLRFGSEVFPGTAQVGADGKVSFENVPGKFLKDSIRLVTDALQQHFKVVRQNTWTAAQDTELVFELEPIFEKYTGKIVRFDSGEPVPGAIITIGNHLASDTTNGLGDFELKLAEKQIRLPIFIQKGSGEMNEEILLSKERLQRLEFKPDGN